MIDLLYYVVFIVQQFFLYKKINFFLTKIFVFVIFILNDAKKLHHCIMDLIITSNNYS